MKQKEKFNIMFLTCYEIGCKLFIVLMVLLVFTFAIAIIIIANKKCTECKKICEECKSRNLMYENFSSKIKIYKNEEGKCCEK